MPTPNAPEALGARTTFALRAVAEDEPFGAGFTSLDPVDAEELWRAEVGTHPASDVHSLLVAVAAKWEIALSAHKPGPIAPADKLVLVGPSAISSTIVSFHRGRDLDWSDQVVIVATPPGHRQLAALGGAVLGATKPARIVSTTDSLVVRGYRLVASSDADPADTARARELAA